MVADGKETYRLMRYYVTFPNEAPNRKSIGHCEVLSDEPLPSTIEINTLVSLMAGEDGPREIAFLNKQRRAGLYLHVLQV